MDDPACFVVSAYRNNTPVITKEKGGWFAAYGSLRYGIRLSSHSHGAAGRPRYDLCEAHIRLAFLVGLLLQRNGCVISASRQDVAVHGFQRDAYFFTLLLKVRIVPVERFRLIAHPRDDLPRDLAESHHIAYGHFEKIGKNVLNCKLRRAIRIHLFAFQHRDRSVKDGSDFYADFYKQAIPLFHFAFFGVRKERLVSHLIFFFVWRGTDGAVPGLIARSQDRRASLAYSHVVSFLRNGKGDERMKTSLHGGSAPSSIRGVKISSFVSTSIILSMPCCYLRHVKAILAPEKNMPYHTDMQRSQKEYLRYIMLLPRGFSVQIHRAEEGGFWAKVLELPGCNTQGDDFIDLIAMINDAVFTWFNIPQKMRKALGYYVPQISDELRKKMEADARHAKIEEVVGHIIKEKKTFVFSNAGLS